MKTTARRTKKPTKRLQHHVRMAVVPHKKNQYRPHLIRWQGLAVVAVVMVVAQFGYNAIQNGSVLGQTTTINGQRLLADTNSARAQHNLMPLRESSQLDQAAQLKVQSMFKDQYWAHVAPDGTQPWHWFQVAGYHYAAAGENLAKGFHTSDGTVTAWMNSPEHRANILNQHYQDVGFAVTSGVLDDHQTTLVVALYGQPTTAALQAMVQPQVLAATDQSLSLVARLGVGVRSMTPALVGSLVLLLGAIIVALLAHTYRNKLPKVLRQGWYRHHGLYKAVGMLSIAIILVALYGGGKI